jgi:FemAB-related protein (PEP-CTERM system-associated)
MTIMGTTVTTDKRVRVRELTRQDDERWDAFVRETPGGLPLQLSGWRDVMRETYGYRTYYLLAEEDGFLRGVLPLFAVSSLLTGKRLMTMPGGLCAVDESAATMLLKRAAEIAGQTGAGSVIIQDSRKTWSSWPNESDHVYWLLPLPDEEEVLWKELDGNIRRQVRKARKNGLRAEVNRSGASLEPFYDMFSRFTHQAGTPVFSRAFLENVVKYFPDEFNIALIWHEQKVIAGYFQLEMGDTMYGMWGAGLPEELKLRPAYLALWEIMSDAISNDFAFLDMGRSPAESSASDFKGQWGGTSAPVYQLTNRENGNYGDNSVTNQVQSDQKFQLFMQLWPKLPLSVTRRLGPKLRRHVPFA